MNTDRLLRDPVHSVRIRKVQSNHEGEADRPFQDGRSIRLRRIGRVDRISFFVILVIGALGTVTPESAHAATSELPSGDRRPAVSAPNARFSARYDYAHTDSTEETFETGGSTSTLRIGKIETQSGQALMGQRLSSFFVIPTSAQSPSTAATIDSTVTTTSMPTLSAASRI